MGKLLFAILIFLVSCALFKWPGYLVRDDADARLREFIDAPGTWFRKIGRLEKKAEEDPLAANEAGDPFAGAASQDTTQGGVYPIPMTIHNTEGTALDVFVLGKGPDFVRFRRNSDNYLFDLKVTALSEASRTTLKPLPANLGAQDYQQTVQAQSAAPPPPENRQSLAEGIREEIERNKKEISKQMKISRSNVITKAQKKAAVQAMERLQRENLRLEHKLADYKDKF